MAYSRNPTWHQNANPLVAEPGSTAISATAMNHIEDGIFNAAKSADDISEVLANGRLSSAAIDTVIDKNSLTAVPLSRFYDNVTPPSDFTAAFDAAMATGRAVYIDKPGLYPASLTYVNQSVRISHVAGARLIQPLGKSLLTVTASPTASWNASGVSALFWWKNLARSNDAMPIIEGVRTISLTTPSQISQFKRGDKLFLSSDEMYRDKTYVTSSAAEAGTFKAGWLGASGIKGIALKINSAGTIPVRSIITGASSGAVGLVSSVAIDYANAIWVMFDNVSAAFTPGETLNISGASVGTADSPGLIVPSSHLEDTTYGGNLRLVKGNESIVVDVDIEYDTATDPETAVGQSDRKVAITVEGVINANIRYHAHRGYKAALTLMSTLGGRFYGSGGNLSNIPEEDAFGYLCMLRGFTEHAEIYLDAINCRHALTTNAYALLTPTTDLTTLLRTNGTAKHNHIRGIARECTAAAWDTHAGGWMNHFDGVVAMNTRPTGKNDAVPVGIQNRSFATMVTDAKVFGCMIGVLDHTYRWQAEVDNTIIYRNVFVEQYQQLGFYHGTSTNVASTTLSKSRYLLDHVTVGAQILFGTPPFEQIGFCIGGAETTMINPVSRNAAHADVQIRHQIPKLIVHDLFVDAENAPAAATGSGYIVQFKAPLEGSRRAAFTGITLNNNITGNARRTIFRVEGGVTANLRRTPVSAGSFRMFHPTGTGPTLSEVAPEALPVTAGVISISQITTI